MLWGKIKEIREPQRWFADFFMISLAGLEY